MNTVELSIWGVIAALVLFVVIGGVLLVQSLRVGHAVSLAEGETREKGFRAGIRRYVGPVKPENALLNAPLRVLLELVCGSCGIPGLGWMVSTRVAIGLPLLAVVPSFVYGFYPVYLAMTGHFLDSPYVALRYLPFLGVASAALLAVAEYRSARAA